MCVCAGQAGAIRLAISKALAGLPGQHLPVLEGAGLLVRDPRMVERKKPGQKKARKKFAWYKSVYLLYSTHHITHTCTHTHTHTHTHAQGEEIMTEIKTELHSY